MNNQFKRLKACHYQTAPFYLTNCWDVSSARLIENQGASVIGTSSYAVAETLGYNDGEALPFRYLIWLAERLVASTTLPVTIDAEGLYSTELAGLRQHAERLIRTGISGLNFEDQLEREGSLTRWSIEDQARRIRCIKEVAETLKVSVFLNARTDVFFQSENQQQSVREAVERGCAYAEAGADGFFIPGTMDANIIQTVVREVPLPVNIMLDSQSSSLKKWQELGVKRISTGPYTFLENQERLAENLKEVMVVD